MNLGGFRGRGEGEYIAGGSCCAGGFLSTEVFFSCHLRSAFSFELQSIVLGRVLVVGRLKQQ